MEAVSEILISFLALLLKHFMSFLNDPEALKGLFSNEGAVQLVIAVLGFYSIKSALSEDEVVRKRACWFGLAGQPFWLYSTITSASVGMFLVSCGYTYVWGRAFWKLWLHDYFVKKKETA